MSSRRSSRRWALRSRRRRTREEHVADKNVVRTDGAPGPFQGAPYSQAIVANGFVFVSGQLGVRLGASAPEGDVAQQTEQAFVNLRAILEAAGSSLDQLVKTTVFLQDLGDFA